MTKVVILGGGPGGYEAALVATQLGAQVTIIERDGIGGSAVLSDVVPSKALVAVAEAAIDTRSASLIGVHTSEVHIELDDVNARLKKWAANQSRHIFDSLIAAGVHIIAGTGFYHQQYYPEWIDDWSVTQIADRMLGHIVDGFPGTGIKAGIMAELGTAINASFIIITYYQH